MRLIFYIGMFMTLFVLGMIMIRSGLKDANMIDVIVLSLILSLGITFMYMGQFG